jgi:hypothetical protein
MLIINVYIWIEDERKKRSFDEMFGGDSDDSDDERITSNVGNKKSVTADASGLFGSDSEVSDDEEQEKKKTTTTKIKPSKQKKEETKKNEISRLRRDGKDDDSDQDTATSGRPQQEEEEEEEDDFIDKEDDLADVLGEYNQDRQEFDDERAPDGGEYDDDDEEQEGRGRKPFKETDFFDETLKSLKTHRGRTKMNLSVQDMEQITQELLYRMDKAQQDDQKSIQEGKPALEKVS